MNWKAASAELLLRRIEARPTNQTRIREPLTQNARTMDPNIYGQTLNPLEGKIFWSAALSTLFAAMPVVVLFWLLVPMRWLATKAGAAGAAVAIVIAVVVFQMPVQQALWAFVYGAGFGLLPVGWTIFCAMLLYNITVETGQFTIVRRSIAGLSGDARIQAILIGFSFGAFLEGAAGGGTPVAICGAIMVGLGFNPFLAAVLCLIANTSPVAYGGLGTPIIVLADMTSIDGGTISTMAAHQLPFLSLLVPAYMVRCMCGWKQTFEVWPALLVSGGSFAVFQYFFGTLHSWIGVVAWPMTDIGGGIFSLVVTAIFLSFWKPKNEWHFDSPASPASPETGIKSGEPPIAPSGAKTDDPHAAGAASLMGEVTKQATANEKVPLTGRNITLAWMPFILMSIFLMLTGIVRQMEGDATRKGPVYVPGTGIQTNYQIPVPTLHKRTIRDEKLRRIDKFGRRDDNPDKALFNFAWLTAPGTAVMFAAILSIFMLRMSMHQTRRVMMRTIVQMKIPIPTIAFMLGLSYVTKFSGMDATLGYAFANTGVMYPFFAAILGWLGVFLTGTDAGSNALFGSLQQITARTIHGAGAFGPVGSEILSVGQAEVLISTANSTGGVMGKMIDAQSICVATAATHQLGKEADIFKAVIWHSIILAAIVGLMTLLQAYVYPFTLMVPTP